MTWFGLKRQDRIVRSTLVWVLVAQAVSIFPLFFKLPFWVAVIWWSALVWRIQISRAKARFPNAFLKVILGVVCIALIIATYSGKAGVEPMVGFLVCSFVLKLIEMHSQKDALIILFIGFVAIAAQFLFAQGIIAAVYGAFAFWVLVTAWRAVMTNRQQSFREHLQTSGLMLAQCAPMLLVMFVIMPRLGPLWSVPLPQGSGHTGFSDSLTLGDIGELVKSHEVAFRAEFDGVPPAMDELYWRGLTLDDFDGRQWRSAGSWQYVKVGDQTFDQTQYDYRVIMEPHYQQWLFVLGYPIRAKSQQFDVRRTKDGLLSSVRPVTQKLQYSVSSLLALNSSRRLSTRDLARLTDYPEAYNPKTQALVSRWQSQGLTQAQAVEAALGLFHERFRYTLKPPLLGAHSVDDFLFTSQSGFCEHFASSFVLLMRMMGLPARIVVGYQGGTYNPDGFLTVRQSDAHAWAEVYIKGSGWIRVDPTAAVAPSRVERGISEALEEDDRALLTRAHWQGRWLNQFRGQWESMSYSWQRWVLNYNNDTKEAFLTRWLGGFDVLRVGLVFVCASLGILLLVALTFWWRGKGKPQLAEDKLLAKALKLLRQQGYVRAPHETLMHLADKIGEKDPSLQKRFMLIVKQYYRMKYQFPGAQDLMPLKLALKQLRRASTV